MFKMNCLEFLFMKMMNKSFINANQYLKNEINESDGYFAHRMYK